ncbi:hypothetical protein L345_16853, partial [Ophiophagus hannah]
MERKGRVKKRRKGRKGKKGKEEEALTLTKALTIPHGVAWWVWCGLVVWLGGRGLVGVGGEGYCKIPFPPHPT